MPRSAKPKPSSQEQRERFEQTARELGVELDEDKLKEALRRMKEPPDKGADRRENED